MTDQSIATLDQTLLTQMVRAVVEAVEPSQVILFGSYAKGTANAGSDIDFLIVEDKGFGLGRSRRKEAAKVWRVLAKFGIPTDLDSQKFYLDPGLDLGRQG